MDAQLVISFDRKDKPFSYQSKSLLEFNLIKHKWQPVILAVEFPKEIEPDDILLAYFWNPSKKIFFADDLKIEVFSGVNPYKRFTR